MDLGPTEMALPSFCNDITSLRNHRVEIIKISETGFALAIALSVPPSCSTSVPPKSLTFTSFTLIGLTEFMFGPTDLGSKCVTVGFWVEAIYTPPPTLHLRRETSEHAYTSNIDFLRENHLVLC